MASVKEAGEALSPEIWRTVMACGDHLDRFPCKTCEAVRPGACTRRLPAAVSRAASEYVNGYGYEAARRLTQLPRRGPNDT